MIRRARLVRAGIAAVLCVTLGSTLAAAQQQKKSNPSWNEIGADNRQILAQLAPPEWDQLDASRKAKWLGIANRYPSMTPTEQRRVQSRMQKWVKLSPAERRQARETFRQIDKLPPEKKQDLARQWNEYLTLPAHERSSLAAPPPASKPQERTRRTPSDKAKSPPASL